MLTEFLSLPVLVQISLSGFLVGLLVGLTGVGAGAITTPLLISGFGVSPAVAVGTDLLFAGLTKIGGAWRHHKLGHVNWKILAYLSFGSIAAALATLAVIFIFQSNKNVLGTSIRSVLAVTLVVSAIAVPLIPILLTRRTKFRSRTIKIRPIATISMGLLIGAIVTLSSVGAGAIGVTVLTLLYPMLRARHIVGTDIVHAVPLTLISGFGHLSIGNVDYTLLAALLVGSIPGIMLGSRLTSKFPDWILRLILSAVLAFSAYLVLTKV